MRAILLPGAGNEKRGMEYTTRFSGSVYILNGMMLRGDRQIPDSAHNRGSDDPL